MSPDGAGGERIATPQLGYNVRVPRPYVGLRPYSELEHGLFFGRDRDAQLLVNKILSARLTLVYGASGVGKSSLLRARVAPDLRDEEIGDTEVVFFDGWREPDAEAAIKREIATVIGSDAAGFSTREPLTAWAGLVNQVRRKPLILILDQFEQFCRIHAGNPDPLRKELAALVRAEIPAHVVLSLREEFLAGLESFTNDIVTIYDSMFRLEHLSDQGARDAIVLPAEKFGVSVQSDLVEALIKDLKKRDEAVAFSVGPTAPGVELPFLQIICEKLWKELQESQYTGAKDQLPLSLYERLDGREGIIRRYVEGLTSAFSPRMQEDAAVILRRLAPRSGIKASYPPSQLSEDTGLPINRVERILQPFADHYVLRPRLIGDTRWYELYHDAYIQVLAAWIDGKLTRRREREKRWRLMRWGLAAALVAAVAGYLYSSFAVYQMEADAERLKNQAEEYRVTEGDIEQAIKDEGDLAGEKGAQTKQRRHAESAFLESAKHSWNRIKDTDDQGIVNTHVNELKSRFTKPTTYKVSTAHGSRSATREDYISEPACTEGWARGTEPKAGTTSVKLVFDSDLNLDESTLRCAWMQVVSGFRQNQPAMLLPLHIDIDASNQAAKHAIRVYIGEVPINVDVNFRYHDIGVRTEDLMRYRSLWKFFNDENSLDWPYFVGDYTSLPHWTAPLLRAADIDTAPEEFLIIEKAALDLSRDQRPTLTKEVVKYLIQRAGKTAPETVKEALRARGSSEGIREVLLEMIEQEGKIDNIGFIFENFGTFLDAIGRFPRSSQQSSNASAAISRSSAAATAPRLSATPEGFSAAQAAKGVSTQVARHYRRSGATSWSYVPQRGGKQPTARRLVTGQRRGRDLRRCGRQPIRSARR
jgi:hypothetical protein